MIATCTCSHEEQDKLYGKGRRVFNPMGLKGKSGGRCTVCKREDASLISKEEKSDTTKEKVKKKK